MGPVSVIFLKYLWDRRLVASPFPQVPPQNRVTVTRRRHTAQLCRKVLRWEQRSLDSTAYFLALPRRINFPCGVDLPSGCPALS